MPFPKNIGLMAALPQAVIQSFAKEAKRILRPGGTVSFIDNNPQYVLGFACPALHRSVSSSNAGLFLICCACSSETMQSLPPVLFTLMKSTEPWSDQYYAFDLEAAMREEGFKEVLTVPTDHRHRTVLGIA